MDKRVDLGQCAINHGWSLRGALCASTLLHVLPLGGLFLWQGGVINEVSNNQKIPLSIKLVYESQDKIPKEVFFPSEISLEDELKAESPLMKPEVNQPSMVRRQSNETGGASEDTVTIEKGTIVKPLSSNKKPPYPLRAREEKIQGTVYLRLTIHSSGHVITANLLEPRAHPLLEKAALEAVQHWAYVISGPDRTIVRDIPIIFELES